MSRSVGSQSSAISPEGIKKNTNEFTDTASHMFYGDDLIARLIRDNQDLWREVLNNPFCTKMKTASADDWSVLEGFKWYMVQDFLYCKKLIKYEEARELRAANSIELCESKRKVESKREYADCVFNICTNQSPSGLGIKESAVLGARETDALKSYTDFQISTANSVDWVLSLVALVPCIQSYYQIAMNLKESSTHQDTTWYKLWVLDNAQYESSTIKQRTFFKQNADRWKGQYEKANEIFKRACQGEIDMWATALNPEACA